MGTETLVATTQVAKTCVHLSRAAAEAITEATGAALISICDPQSPQPRIVPGAWLASLSLRFHDACSPDPARPWLRPPRPSHARRIARFVRSHAHHSIAVHCEMGVSRSAAVCVLLSRLGWKYVEAPPYGLTFANDLLVRLLLLEFNLQETCHDTRD
jgi:predicted protein tyrosine phosphatase